MKSEGTPYPDIQIAIVQMNFDFLVVVFFFFCFNYTYYKLLHAIFYYYFFYVGEQGCMHTYLDSVCCR